MELLPFAFLAEFGVDFGAARFLPAVGVTVSVWPSVISLFSLPSGGITGWLLTSSTISISKK